MVACEWVAEGRERPMFQALSAESVIPAQAQHVVGLHRSLNTPTLLIAGGEPSPCVSTIVGVANPDGTYSLYVALKPVARTQSLLFRSSPSSIPVTQYRSVEQAALVLVERYGFQMERVELGQLSLQARLEHMRGLPLSPAPLTMASESSLPARPSPSPVHSTAHMPAVFHSTSERVASPRRSSPSESSGVGAAEEASSLARSGQSPATWGAGMLEASAQGPEGVSASHGVSASPLSSPSQAAVRPLAPTAMLPRVSSVGGDERGGASLVTPEEAISVLGRLLASF